MKLSKYDNKCVKILDIFGKEYEGNASYNSKEYDESEFGKNMESLQILNFLFYKDTVKKIEILENGFTDDYGEIEEIIVSDGIDDVIDAFEYEDDDHIIRIIKYIKDNHDITNRDEMIKKVKDYLKDNKNEKIIEILKELS